MSDAQEQLRLAPTRRRGMLSRILLLGGLGAALACVLPAVPREHTLVVVFGSAKSEQIRRIELAWQQEQAQAPLGGAAIDYERLQRPKRLRQQILAPNGDYIVSFTVEQGGENPQSIEFERRVRLQGEETSVFIEGALK